eukprot:COSAG04_NODE_985_length_8992_cov_18.901844_3_plen_184_part_00
MGSKTEQRQGSGAVGKLAARRPRRRRGSACAGDVRTKGRHSPPPSRNTLRRAAVCAPAGPPTCASSSASSMDSVEKCARCARRPGAAGGRGSLGPETKLDTERERGECAGRPRGARCKPEQHSPRKQLPSPDGASSFDCRPPLSRWRDGRLSESVKRIPSPEQTVQSRFKAHRYGLVRRFRLR